MWADNTGCGEPCDSFLWYLQRTIYHMNCLYASVLDSALAIKYVSSTNLSESLAGGQQRDPSLFFLHTPFSLYTHTFIGFFPPPCILLKGSYCNPSDG
ncbi:predicted protein [Lichtheimia corymbifera JMRC:FSU:9682]|uniref:Uncharacterized protein n=1 Tax=Lichtheimia corymbifera JMRC:FSU:9682 TaxID=1263082 RepID=A0A068RZ39_9FUNG|nr:predicted protein [Lichtheimia corymbifera JMRC:FSU:9682]